MYSFPKDAPKIPTGRNIRKTSGQVRVIASSGRRMIRPHLPPDRYCTMSSTSPPKQKLKHIM